MLITLSNVLVTALGTDANGKIATAKQGSTTFGVGAEAIELTAANTCYESITGFWTTLQAPGATTKPNAFGFIPLVLGPTSATACN